MIYINDYLQIETRVLQLPSGKWYVRIRELKDDGAQVCTSGFPTQHAADLYARCLTTWS